MDFFDHVYDEGFQIWMSVKGEKNEEEKVYVCHFRRFYAGHGK